MPKKREFRPEERARMLNMRNNGKSVIEIAKTFGTTRDAVYKICRRLSETGSPENAIRTGRRRKTTVYDDRAIVRIAKKNPRTSAREIGESLNLNIDVSRIRARLREASLFGRIARRKPMISEKNRQKRLEFARTHVNKPIEFWKSILWSDESKFELFSSKRRQRVWRKVGQAFCPTFVQCTVKGTVSVMVWGCFNWNGTGSLHFIDGIMRADDYIEILESELVQSVVGLEIESSFIFQQDNDPKHTAKKTRKFFDENFIKVLNWPPQSPDLNPIEHL